MSGLFRLPALLGIGLIRIYQKAVSPLLGARCRFYPSCSAYAAQAVGRHGLVKGLYLGARRLGRCHPWNLGGVDEVPAEFSFRGGEPPFRVREAGDLTSRTVKWTSS